MGRDDVWADEETSGVLAGSVPDGCVVTACPSVRSVSRLGLTRTRRPETASGVSSELSSVSHANGLVISHSRCTEPPILFSFPCAQYSVYVRNMEVDDIDLDFARMVKWPRVSLPDDAVTRNAPL